MNGPGRENIMCQSPELRKNFKCARNKQKTRWVSFRIAPPLGKVNGRRMKGDSEVLGFLFLGGGAGYMSVFTL